MNINGPIIVPGQRDRRADGYTKNAGIISWNFNPMVTIAATAPTAGTIYAAAVSLLAGDIVNNIVVGVSVAGGGTVPTSLVVGLADSTGKIVAQSAEQKTNTTWTTIGLGPVPLSAAYTVPTTGNYFVVILQVGSWGTTQVSLDRGINSVASFSGSFLYATGGTTQTVLPATGSSFVPSSSGVVGYFAGVS